MDYLKQIDIPQGRKAILKSISDYRKRHLLAQQFEFYFSMIDPATMARKHADLFKAHLIDVAPELKVHFVGIGKDTAPGDRVRWTVNVSMYDLDPGDARWQICTDAAGKFMLKDALIGDSLYGRHATFLEALLPRFAAKAMRFNELLDQLAIISAQMQEGIYPVYPASELFYTYNLRDARTIMRG